MLERIIAASSNPGDLVLDPFCGCGKAVDAAQRLDRRWIGIDISYLAIEVIDERMRRIYGEGVPPPTRSAASLSTWKGRGRWPSATSSSSSGGRCHWSGGSTTSSAAGTAGWTATPPSLGAGQGSGSIVISVKGGASNPGFVRDLIGTVQGHHADKGLMITLHPPTKKMAEAAATAGIYRHPNGQSYPRVQIITVELLLKGGRRDWPSMIDSGLGAARPAPAASTRARTGKRSA